MIDIDLIRNNTADVIANLAKRGVAAEDVNRLLRLDKEWRDIVARTEALRSEQKATNDKIANATPEERQTLISQVKEHSNEYDELTKKLSLTAEQRESAWRALPNLVQEDVPEGAPENFTVMRVVPEQVPVSSFSLKSYLELTAPKYLDLERAAKVSGSRFVYVRGQLARLQIALVSFVFDQLATEGFIPVIPPTLISQSAMAGMGYLDTHAEEVYQTQDDLCLIGTSEQSIGPMHMNEILDAEDLPLRYVGYSPCYRREAGSHGKDVKGIIRMHQFDKVEMFSFVRPEQSTEEHDRILAWQEKIVQALELPYRVIKLTAQDLGAPSSKTYDIETWIPSENRYRETHSTSNTTDFQARRLNIRTKTTDGNVQKVHMLNGTAIAIGRTLAALIENHQQEDGSITIPRALKAYVPFEAIKTK